jgi:hypothetical protein
VVLPWSSILVIHCLSLYILRSDPFRGFSGEDSSVPSSLVLA